MTVAASCSGLTPAGFVSEVQDFRGFVADPAPTLAEKKRALGVIVKPCRDTRPCRTPASPAQVWHSKEAGVLVAGRPAHATSTEQPSITRRASRAEGHHPDAE